MGRGKKTNSVIITFQSSDPKQVAIAEQWRDIRMSTRFRPIYLFKECMDAYVRQQKNENGAKNNLTPG